MGGDDSAADTRLIVAAPEMLELLRMTAAMIPIAPRMHPRDLLGWQRTVTALIARIDDGDEITA